MRIFSYDNRRFASLVAAHSYHKMRGWMSGSSKSRVSKPKLKNKWSVTPTKSKTKQEEMTFEDQPKGIHQSYVEIDTGLKPLKSVVSGHILYRDEFTSNFSFTSNYQMLTCPWFVGTTSQYLTSTSNATATNRDSVSYSSFFDLNPEQGINAFGQNAASTVKPTVDWIGIKSATVYMDIVNRGNTPIYMKVHYFMATTDNNTDPLGMYDAACSYASSIYSSLWTVPATANTLPASGGSEDVLYTAPSTSACAQVFCLPYTNLLNRRVPKKTWKKLKSKSFTLAAGDNHRLTTVMHLNQFGVKERLNTIASIYPKGTVCCVLEMQGGAAVETGGSTTYSPGSIGVVYTRKINIAPLKSPNARFETTYAGQGTVKGAAAASSVQILKDDMTASQLGVTF